MNPIVFYGEVPGAKTFKITAVDGRSHYELAWVYEPRQDGTWEDIPLIVMGPGILPETDLRGFMDQTMSRPAIETVKKWEEWLQTDSHSSPSQQLIQRVLDLGRNIELRIQLLRRCREFGIIVRAD
jgi:hypothetical protein